jgi:hypothetical protein
MDFLNNLVSQAQAWVATAVLQRSSHWQLLVILAAFLAAFLISRLVIWPRLEPN